LRLPRWFLWATFLHFPSGFLAVLAGWFTAEVGRQPWVVYGLIRTEDAITPSLSGEAVLLSLAAFAAVYALIFSAGTLYIYRLLRVGLDESEAGPPPAELGFAPAHRSGAAESASAAPRQGAG
jgi:cytochrome bd ubiquinol oxidase subunit I